MAIVFSAKGKPYPGFEIEITTGAACSVCEAIFDGAKVAMLDNSSAEYSPIVLCSGCLRRLIQELN